MTDYGTTLLLLRIDRIVLLIAQMSLAGQGIVYALSRASGADPQRNVFYETLAYERDALQRRQPRSDKRHLAH